MLMRFKSLILISTLILGACATMPVHEALPVAARDKIVSTEVAAPVKQNEIYVFVPDSQIAAAGGGGLLLALVDAGVNSVRTDKAEDAVKPLRDSLVDYNFDQMLAGEFRKSLSQVSWLGVDNVHVVKDVTPASLDNILDNSRNGAVLFTATDYHVSNNADVLTVALTVCLFGHNDALRLLKEPKDQKVKTAVANSLYHNTLVFETKAPDATDDRPHNIATWSANNGAAIRNSLQKGASQLAAILAADLQQTYEAPDASKGKRTINNAMGDVVASDDDGSLVRFANGTLTYAANGIP